MGDDFETFRIPRTAVIAVGRSEFRAGGIRYAPLSGRPSGSRAPPLPPFGRARII